MEESTLGNAGLPRSISHSAERISSSPISPPNPLLRGIFSSLYHLRRPSFFPTRFLRRFASRISSGMIIVAKISKESQGTDPHRQNLSKLFFSLTFPPASLTILSKNQFTFFSLLLPMCLILSS